MAETPTVVECPNCGLTGTGDFCAGCGQSRRSYRASLWQITGQLAAETFEVDGRLWRTLRELFTNPGGLSQAFSEDRRASYIVPLRLYLFASLLFFFLLAVTESGGEVTADLDEDAVTEPAAVEEGDSSQTDPAVLKPYLSPRDWATVTEILDDPKRFEAHEWIQQVANTFAESIDAEGSPGESRRFVLPAIIRLIDDPSEFSQRTVDNLPIAMFVLLPFYALLLKLLFIRSGRFYPEHLVFALHLHVLAFLLFSGTILLPDSETGLWSAIETLLWLAALVYLGVYTYLAMRNYYGGSRWSVGWRFLSLGVGYLVLLLPALLLVMATTFFQL